MRSRRVSLGEADGRILVRDILAPLPLPPFTNSAVDGYAVRGRDLPQDAEQAFPVAGRVQAGARPVRRSSRAMRCGFSPARRCPMAPTPCSCRRMSASTIRQGRAPGGPEARRQCASRRRRHCLGHAALKAGRRLRPQDVALAAAFGLTHVDVAGACASRCSRPATNWCRRASRARAAQLFDSNRFMLAAMLARLGCEVSDLGIIRDDRAAMARRPEEGRRHATI